MRFKGEERGGTGSGEVNSHFKISIERALEKENFTIATKDWLISIVPSYDSRHSRSCASRVAAAGGEIVMPGKPDTGRSDGVLG